MTLEQAIFEILLEAGSKGLALRKIARHAHNLTNTFFEQQNYEEVYAQVQKYLRKNSRNPSSLVAHASKRGYYRLNKKSEKYLQFKLSSSQ